jgi:glycosyltransferase involved in cell wall biosynthesis
MSAREMNQTQSVFPKISVIIPVLNPGPGISRCIDSLLSQTLEDIEMIFVDDCGTDGAMDIIHVNTAKDLRIRIIKHAENNRCRCFPQ